MKDVTHLILEEVQKKLGDIKSIAENHWDKQRIEKVIHNFVLNRFDIFLRDKIQTEFSDKVDEIIHNLIEQLLNNDKINNHLVKAVKRSINSVAIKKVVVQAMTSQFSKIVSK